MTIWTEQDIATLKKAIAGGVLRVRYDGPPAREVTYQNLKEMRELLSSMVTEVSQAAGARGYRLAAMRKGV